MIKFDLDEDGNVTENMLLRNSFLSSMFHLIFCYKTDKDGAKEAIAIDKAFESRELR